MKRRFLRFLVTPIGLGDLMRGTLIAVFVLCLVGAVLSWCRITINAGVSLPQTAFRCASYDQSTPLLPGQYVKFFPSVIIQQFLEEMYPDKHFSATLPWIKQIQDVIDDELFVIGSHPQSFDSRLFGTIHSSLVTEVCEPLLP